MFPPLDHLQDGISQKQGQGIHLALWHPVPAAHEEGQRHHQHCESRSACTNSFIVKVREGQNRSIQWFVMSFIMQLKYREVYEKSKAQINMDPEAHEIRAAKEAYKNITNVSVWNCQIKKKKILFSVNIRHTWHHSVLSWFQLDYKKKYEATKNKWIWTSDRPDFLNAAKNTLQQSDVRQ